MSDEETRSAGTLDLFLPDWSRLDTVRRHPLPFALWPIGDQSLLFHWFDHAVNEGYECVNVHVIDRPAEVRAAVAGATLWPIPLETVVLHSGAEPPAGAVTVTGLPGHFSTAPQHGWELLEHAAALEKVWLDQLRADPAGDLLCIGSTCRIHPDAILYPPYFIGDNVFIGPGCEIGPHASIGSGSMLAGANLVARSHVAAHTFLGPMTALEDCLLDGGVLYNHRNRARIDHLETHLSSSFLPKPGHAAPSWKERRLAKKLARRLGPPATADGDLTLHDKRVIPAGTPEHLSTRVRWLGEVARGRMRLFGVLPRSRAQMDKLPVEWRSALEQAPVGVFSYADCHGCHTPDHPEEPLHAVYQASLEDETLLPILHDFVSSLEPGGFPA